MDKEFNLANIIRLLQMEIHKNPSQLVTMKSEDLQVLLNAIKLKSTVLTKTNQMQDQSLIEETKLLQQENQLLQIKYNLDIKKSKIFIDLVNKLVMNENYNMIQLDHLTNELASLKKELQGNMSEDSLYSIIVLAEDYVNLKKQQLEKQINELENKFH